MVTVTIHEARHGGGQQTIKLGAAFVRRHAVWAQGIGYEHLGFCLSVARSERGLKRKSHWIARYGTSHGGN